MNKKKLAQLGEEFGPLIKRALEEGNFATAKFPYTKKHPAGCDCETCLPKP